jgi:hypothetical protein
MLERIIRKDENFKNIRTYVNMAYKKPQGAKGKFIRRPCEQKYEHGLG